MPHFDYQTVSWVVEVSCQFYKQKPTGIGININEGCKWNLGHIIFDDLTMKIGYNFVIPIQFLTYNRLFGHVKKRWNSNTATRSNKL